MSRHTPLHIAFRRPWPTTLRGLVLWFFALALIVLGAVNYILTDLPPITEAALRAPLAVASSTTWGWVMTIVALIAVWSSYCHKGRDRYGYFLLGTFCTAWGMGYVAGWLIYDAPLRAVGGSVIWLLFAAVLVTCAGFPSTPLRVEERPGGAP